MSETLLITNLIILLLLKLFIVGNDLFDIIAQIYEQVDIVFIV